MRLPNFNFVPSVSACGNVATGECRGLPQSQWWHGRESEYSRHPFCRDSLYSRPVWGCLGTRGLARHDTVRHLHPLVSAGASKPTTEIATTRSFPRRLLAASLCYHSMDTPVFGAKDARCTSWRSVPDTVIAGSQSVIKIWCLAPLHSALTPQFAPLYNRD